jgi:hypothetical protein
MRIVKKFNQYVRENLGSSIENDLNELDPIDLPEIENDPIDVISTDEYQEEETDPRSLVDGYEEEENLPQEEESHQYIGAQLMNDLAERLGVDVVDNEIEYDGQKINYFSETEKFHIDDKKFETVDEVLDYLTGSSEG